ncbi:nucleoside-binding outer membrane protein [Thalassomonas actiniarum]|uniref:Nucleoside-binding protein n=1 Tax=Thalassomonas actiniarum TaxID=485447 RepID=A0AAE9YNP1_9GAMM|nr:nucleoside-binding outer membrane protein [Thalassomonas actiniarum]WDD98037.1 nucleoside-binding protein [Thalassomonas actiniarum]
MKYLPLFLCLFVGANAQAKTNWSDFSLTYLNGSNYELGDEHRKVYTFEHVAGTSWGDTFLFVDRLESDNGDNETYAEWQPRYKLTDLDNGVVTSLYLAGMVEMDSVSPKGGEGFSFTNYLAGFGSDIKIPGFDFFQANVYHRENELGDDNYQTTLVWGLPLGALYFDGFIDYASSNDELATSFNMTSQLKYDVAPQLGLTSKLYFGVEYVYWNNKFGVQGVDERNVNLLVKYHF